MHLALLGVLVAAAVPEDPAAAWAPVYAAAGLSAAAPPLDRPALGLYGAGAWRRPLFDYLTAEPLRVPALLERHGRGLVADGATVAGALARAGQMSGLGVRRGLVEPIPARLRQRLHSERPLAAALDAIRAAAPTRPATGYDDPPTDDLPLPVQQEAAVLLLAAVDAVQWRELAFAEAPAAGLSRHIEDLRRFASTAEDAAAGAESLAHQRRLDRLIAGLDIAALSAGAQDLALVLDETRVRLAGVDPALVATRRYGTPFGDVVIAGGEADQHGEGTPLLVIDLGGDDRYTSGAAAFEAERPVAVVLDLAGNDTYEAAADVPASWGGALGGIALLVDAGGNDTYAGGDVTQGCGIGGVGLLWDGGGDDAYAGHAHAQGSAAFGLGALVDVAGNDRYRAVHRVQGFGYTLGCGVLVDREGRDEYLADDETIEFPSAQSREHNTSLAQGFGFGRRADYTDGHSLAGGIGWLADGGGDDRYSCGVFGQGGGYWFGVGALTDLSGDDAYQGVWYVQGAAAHFAVGALLDAEGADQYEATMNMALGAGHDFSLGWLADLAGNDRYQAPNLALGAGNANGVGYAWDVAGNDTYSAAAGLNLGRAALPGSAEELARSPRALSPSAGLFLDGGGNDTYPRQDQGNGRTWRAGDPALRVTGAGVDAG